MRSPEQLLEEWNNASKDKPLCLAADEAENFIRAMRLSEANFPVNKRSIELLDKEKLFANSVQSPITKEAFHNRRQWNNHLKQNNCVEYGNDLNNTKMRTDIRGDFDCRKELTQAVNQVMG